MATKAKNKGGRPKDKFEKFFDEQDCLHMLSLYEEGASDVEIKAYIIKKKGSFSEDLWRRWLKEEELFSATIKRGRILSGCWWEKNGRKNIHNKDFNSTLWYMNMKNRFGWKDKQDITTDGEKIVGPTIYCPKEEK